MVIEKIQKLLALANNAGATQAEAEAAMASAHRLLARHNLDIASIPDPETNATPSPEVGRANCVNTHTWPWARQIWLATAQLNFCDYFYIKERTRLNHNVIGTQVNTIATINMANYLTQTIIRLGNDYLRSLPREERKNSALGGFHRGCALELCKRLRELKEQAEAPSTADAGLPAVYDAHKGAIEEYKAEHFPNLKSKASRMSASDSRAVAAGRQAGQNVNLHDQLGGPQGARQRLAAR